MEWYARNVSWGGGGHNGFSWGALGNVIIWPPLPGSVPRSQKLHLEDITKPFMSTFNRKTYPYLKSMFVSYVAKWKRILRPPSSRKSTVLPGRLDLPPSKTVVLLGVVNPPPSVNSSFFFPGSLGSVLLPLFDAFKWYTSKNVGALLLLL